MLVGDASHAIVPFYGQGMNAAFEDCLLLARLLTESTPARTARGLDFSEASWRRSNTSRKPNADAIADMAVENFVEMRDKTGSAAFLYRKRVEQTVHHFFPDKVTPRYNLVSFSTVPYVEARQKGRDLDAVLDQIVGRLPQDSLKTMGEGQWKERVRELAAAFLGGTDGGSPPAASSRTTSRQL